MPRRHPMMMREQRYYFCAKISFASARLMNGLRLVKQVISNAVFDVVKLSLQAVFV